MKVDLNTIDRNNFMTHEHIVNGEVLTLVQPIHIGAKWTKENKIFRSSVWNADGVLVSAGFPKFTNWGEAPEQFPVPTSLTGTTVMEKLDGSLLIVSKYNGNFILRTRGTVDAAKLDNGFELEQFKTEILSKLLALNQYSEYVAPTWDFSLLFEWTSPFQKIVINYGDVPKWFLVGGVRHADYSLFDQEHLDNLAKGLDWQRPATFVFGSIDQLMQAIEQWKDKEGVCIYSSNGQAIHKAKSAWYLVRHHMKSELSSLDKVIDFWVNAGRPDYAGLRDAVVKFDVELWAEPTIGFVSRIADGCKEVQKIVEGMHAFLKKDVLPMPTRKLQAVVITQSYGKTNRASFLFKLLDGKQLGDDDYKKLLYQVLK